RYSSLFRSEPARTARIPIDAVGPPDDDVLGARFELHRGPGTRRSGTPPAALVRPPSGAAPPPCSGPFARRRAGRSGGIAGGSGSPQGDAAGKVHHFRGRCAADSPRPSDRG